MISNVICLKCSILVFENRDWISVFLFLSDLWLYVLMLYNIGKTERQFGSLSYCAVCPRYRVVNATYRWHWVIFFVASSAHTCFHLWELPGVELFSYHLSKSVSFLGQQVFLVYIRRVLIRKNHVVHPSYRQCCGKVETTSSKHHDPDHQSEMCLTDNQLLPVKTCVSTAVVTISSFLEWLLPECFKRLFRYIGYFSQWFLLIWTGHKCRHSLP